MLYPGKIHSYTRSIYATILTQLLSHAEISINQQYNDNKKNRHVTFPIQYMVLDMLNGKQATDVLYAYASAKYTTDNSQRYSDDYSAANQMLVFLHRLGERILNVYEEECVARANCIYTPKMVSRILWSVSTLLSILSHSTDADSDDSGIISSSSASLLNNNEDKRNGKYPATTTAILWHQLRETEQKIFNKLSPILLLSTTSTNEKSQMTSTDASMTMYAFAKSSYVLDMGIFDYLAERMASPHDGSFLLEATVRQLSTALWSCGKMSLWENQIPHESLQMTDDDGFPTQQQQSSDRITYTASLIMQPPPYQKHALQMAQKVVSKPGFKSPKDVSQVVWAVARLDLAKWETNHRFIIKSILQPLSQKATECATKCNSQEIANILWGFGKIGYHHEPMRRALVDRLLLNEVYNSCNTQEAANVLYAHGKLRIRDEELFQKMTQVLLKQLQCATPQAIANALWAYSSVRMQPPKDLFDRWAEQKGILGIVALSSLSDTTIVTESIPSTKNP